jgi:fibronectin type 3 domain-containing protein
VANVDAIVAETRTNGLYLVITIGNGANNGNYNAAYITNFWNFYAPRYANETHVLFEIQNEPVAWGPPYSAANATPPGAINMEVAAYNVIRASAPNTPVLLFTYAVFGGTGGASAALTDIHAFNTAVFGNANQVWTNEAVAFHGYNGWQGTSTAVTSLLGSGYPCMMTEYGGGAWGSGTGGLDAEMTSELERLGISWLTFQYIPPTGVSDDVSKPQIYSNLVVNSGLSWSPDYGNFPPARGPYGNGGQPRTVPASYVNNFLTGTPLRIQAEDFDTGGEGVAYHELTTTNLGGQYRANEAVDIETTTDTGGGYDVTGTAAGEWIEYTIWIQVAGYYNLSLRYAAPSNGCAVQVTGNGHDRTGTWVLPGTGGSTTWATATQPVLLEYGRQKMRLNILNGGFNLNWMELTPSSTGFVPNGTYKFLNGANGLALTALTSTNLVGASNYVGSAYQQWNLQHVGGGQYKITAVPNGYSWNVNNGALVTTSGWGTGGNQCYILAPTSGGFYSILPVGNGVSLETSAANPATIDQKAYSGGANQQWALAAPSAPAFPAGLSATAAATTQVNVTWNAVAGATSYNVKRSANSGGPYTTVATGITTTNYTDTVPAGMKFYYVVTAVSGGIESPNSLEATVSLPYPWLTQDVGSVGLTGSASLSSGAFTVTGAGADIWGTSDAFRYAYVTVTGNCTMIARVASVQNIDGWSKAGIMIRDSLNANAVNAYIAATPGNGVTWQYRTSTGGNSGNSATAGLSAPYWVKLVRNGNTFTGFRSSDGVIWTQQGTSQTFTMASTAYIGLALTSHNSSSLCTATFDNVTAPGWVNVTPPPAPASLAATVTNWNVALAWTASSTATSYNVKRAVNYGGPYTVLANVTTTNYTDNALANGVNYYYVVTALNVGGESTNSPQAVVPAQVFAPSGLSATAMSGTQVALVWNAFANADSYNVKRSLVSGGPYTTLVNVTVTNYTDPVSSMSAGYYYVVSALGGVETPNSAEAAVRFPKLAGAIIGTAGSYNSLGDTIANVFDNNLNTFFDGPNSSNGNGCWVGLDFGVGVSNVITQINYCPRSGFESRMVGGIFQGANQAGFSDAVTLATVGTQPAAGAFTSASVTNAAAFRYIRHLSPNGGWGNVAELEFYGYASAIPANTNCPLMSMAVAGTSFAFSWPLTNAGFTLQWSTNLVSPNWVNATSCVPHMLGNQWQVTLPASGDGPVYYRLTK